MWNEAATALWTEVWNEAATTLWNKCGTKRPQRCGINVERSGHSVVDRAVERSGHRHVDHLWNVCFTIVWNEYVHICFTMLWHVRSTSSPQVCGRNVERTSTMLWTCCGSVTTQRYMERISFHIVIPQCCGTDIPHVFHNAVECSVEGPSTECLRLVINPLIHFFMKIVVG